MNPPLTISRFGSATDNTPKPLTVTFDDMTKMLTKHRTVKVSVEAPDEDTLIGRLEAAKKRCPAFSPCTYREGTTRAKGNVEQVFAFVADIDDGTPLADLEPLWTNAAGEPLAYIWYTTFKSRADKPRIRVFFPLAQPVAGADWPDAWRCLSARLTAGHNDENTKDASRLHFLPACPAAWLPEADCGLREGVLVNPADYPIVASDPRPADVPPVAGPGFFAQHAQGNGPRIEWDFRKDGDPEVDDDALVRLIGRMKNGAKFDSLMRGSLAYHGGDESRADMALASMTAWVVGDDPGRVERVFGRSHLAQRGKWTERSDYRSLTIGRAISKCGGQFFDLAGWVKSRREAPKQARAEDDVEDERGGKQSAASWMLTWARNTFDFWQTPDKVAYVTAKEKPRRTMPARSTDFRREVGRAFLLAHNKPPTPAAVQTAVEAVDALAGAAPMLPIYIRKADAGGVIYLDLGTEDWSAVRIAGGRWSIVDDAPVRFRRTSGMMSLPTPERGGDLAELRDYFNVTEEQYPLLVGWLLAALGPHRPYPILAVSGEQGSAKSSLSRFARRLVDPHTLELRRISYELEDLAVAAHSSYVVAFDNISGVSGEFSDALAMMATGGGFGRRKRHTDTEETLVHTKAPLILNGIGEPATRPDLLDRCLMLHLPTIPESARRPESEIEAVFEQARPRLLGALLDAVAVGLERLAEVQLDRLPRMADFARWVVACEPATPWEPGRFIASLDTNRAEAVEIGLEASPLASLVMVLVDQEQINYDTREVLHKRGEWGGTAEELRQALLYLATDDATRKQLPTNARAVGVALKRIAPSLRAAGYTVNDRTLNGRTHWEIREVGKTEVGKTEEAHRRSGQSGKSGQNRYMSTCTIFEEKEEKEKEEGQREEEIPSSIDKGVLPTSTTLPTSLGWTVEA